MPVAARHALLVSSSWHIAFRPQSPRLVRNSTDSKLRGVTRPSQQCNIWIEALAGHRQTQGASVLPPR